MSLNQKTRKYIWLSTKFKVRMNWHLFNILIGLLVFAVLTTAFGGSSSSYTTDYGTSIIYYITNDLIIVFLLIWSFVVGWTLARPAYIDMDVNFVSNRFTSHLSSILYLGFASILGALLSFFSIFLGKSIYFLVYASESLMVIDPYTLTDIAIGAIASICLSFLLATTGYVVGQLVNWSSMFVFILPALIIGNLFLDARVEGALGLTHLVLFFAEEHQWWMLLFKVIVVSIAAYGLIIFLTRCKEVRVS